MSEIRVDMHKFPVLHSELLHKLLTWRSTTELHEGKIVYRSYQNTIDSELQALATAHELEIVNT